MTRPLVHISVTTGHHPSYQALFVRLLGGEPVTGPLRRGLFWRMVSARRAFFCTIDSDYAGFFLVSLLRALRGRRTVGLFLRPLQCFRPERPILYTLKRWIFRALRRMPGLRLFSIIPFDLEPRLSQLCHDWMFDPQMWDLWLDGPPELPKTPLSKRVQEMRGDRKVLIYIGSASHLKGFKELVEIANSQVDRILVVVAGQVPSDFLADADELRAMNMIVEDRYVSDEEILSLYGIADFAWCRYNAIYDQASGVFGRALQTGVEPILRRGSLLEKITARYSDIDFRELPKKTKEKLFEE